MNHENIEVLFKLSAEEDERFSKFIKQQRASLISTPKQLAKRARESNCEQIDQLLKNNLISEAVACLRQYAYEEYLKEESVFNGVILKEISHRFDMPKHIIDVLSQHLFELNIQKESDFKEKLIETFGQYAGAISPYIYHLCLSNTQSRRSRAGKVFEGIIYYFYDYWLFF